MRAPSQDRHEKTHSDFDAFVGKDKGGVGSGKLSVGLIKESKHESAFA
jgi:hypothetical protein